MRKLFAVLLCVGALVQSCNDCEPVSPPGNELVLNFLNFDNLIAEEPSFTIKAPDFEQVYEISNGAPLDLDMVIEDTTRAYRFLLPLPFDTLGAGFVFESTEIDLTDPDNPDTVQRLDTLGVAYTRETVVVSPDCGFFEEIENIEVTYSTFDSTVIFVDALQANDTTNLLLFW